MIPPAGMFDLSATVVIIVLLVLRGIGGEELFVGRYRSASQQLREAARLYASPGKKCSLFYGMGIAHHASGTDNVKSIANLAMLCGKLGVEPGTLRQW